MAKLGLFLTALVLTIFVMLLGCLYMYSRYGGDVAAGLSLATFILLLLCVGLRIVLANREDTLSGVFSGPAPYATYPPKSNRDYRQEADGIDHRQPIGGLLLFLALFAFCMAALGYVLVTYFPPPAN